jgi:hypothetical protein
MADEYIKRQGLLDAYDAAHKGPPGGARKLIAEAPAEDVVQVVRCGVCENWRKHTSELFGRDYGYCRVCMMDTKTEHFCSYGERKDGG